MENKLITTKELLSIIKISFPTLRQYMRKGVIPYYKIGANFRFKLDEVYDAIRRTQ